MLVIDKNTIQECYQELIEHLKSKEETINNTKEENNCCLIVRHPSIKSFWLPYRNISEKYCNEELKWYWSGDNSCKTIGQFAKTWLMISDDGETSNSAYGHILIKKYGFNQIEQVIDVLKKDIHSRRAVLNISDPAIDRVNTKDMQCTIAIQFLVRNGRLEETVYMRSNDVFFGLPYDYIYFISLGQYIAKRLSLELGQYIHHATSMHMYMRDYDKFVWKDTQFIDLDIDKIIGEYYEKE